MDEHDRPRSDSRRDAPTTRRTLCIRKTTATPLPPIPAETGITDIVRANNRFRVVLDTNRYSVPSLYASQRLVRKTFADRLCLYHDHKLIATHTRSYDRHGDFENPDHVKDLLDQRRQAHNAKPALEFLCALPAGPRVLSPTSGSSPQFSDSYRQDHGLE
jgi:hypothetical protein